MKVAIIALHFAEYAWRLATALKGRGETVLLVLGTQNAAAELAGDELRTPDGPGVICIKHYPLKDLRVVGNAYRIASLIRDFAPDVIHIQETFQDYLIFALPVLRREAPIVLTIHDHVTHSGQDSASGVRRRMYTRYLRSSADAFLVHSASIRRELEGMHPSFRDRVWCIPHGVLGRPIAETRDPVPGNVLFFGRIEAYKGLGVLVDAISALQRDGVPVSLTVAGRGNDLARYRATIDRMPNSEVLDRFIPSSEVPNLFQRASIVALPYLDATQSGVAALAANYGRPVVATRTGGLPEMVRDGVSGVIVRPGDARQLAEALRSLIQDPDLARRLSDGARRLASSELSWDVIGASTISVYDRAKRMRIKRTNVVGSTT